MKQTTLNIIALKTALLLGTLSTVLSADIVTKIKSDGKNAEVFLGTKAVELKDSCLKSTDTKAGDDIIVEVYKGKRVLINNSKDLAIQCPKK